MTSDNSNSSRFLLIGDSHLRYSHSYLNQSLPNIIIKSIRGLKWVDYFDDNLSVSSLLLSSEIQSILLSTRAVLFLVGTNSIRIRPAEQIITEIKHIILRLKHSFPQLNYPGGITISLSFPCFKTSKRFSSVRSLLSNINLFNDRLTLLSREIDFEIFNFHIKRHHLAHDEMHLRSYAYRRIYRSISIYFERLL